MGKEKFNFMEFMTQDKPREDKPPQAEPQEEPQEEKTTPSSDNKKPKIKKKVKPETEKTPKDKAPEGDIEEPEAKTKKYTRSVYFNESDQRKIEYLATKLNMSFSYITEQMIHKGIEIYEEANGPIPEKEPKKNRKINKNLF